MAGLPKFWLINGSKKKGKKSVKKVSKKIARKVAKKSVVKKSVVRKARPTTKTVVKKEIVYRAIPTQMPTSIMTEQEKINYKNRGVKPMARRKRAKRSVAKATTKRVKRTSALAKPKISVGRHRITTFYRDGVLRTSRKSKIAKRNTTIKTNPFKIKGIVKNLKPAVVLSATSVGTIIGLNKVMPKIPYVDRIQNSFVKAGVKIALGLIGQMGVKKVVKNDNIANGVLIGAIISALTDFVNVAQNPTVAGIKLNGVKVLGSPLSFGRPKTPLANPNFQMGAIKIPANQNLQAIKFKQNYNADNTVSGCAERY